MDIQDNVFLVTGGASGLGAATAQLIRNHGGKVILADMNEAGGEKLAKELGGVFVKCDVSREEDGQRAVEAATQLGSLRGLVNCAGIAPTAKTVGKDGPHVLDLFANTIGVNLIGTFNIDPAGGGCHVEERTECCGRAGRDREHGVGGGLRWPDRPGGLRSIERRRGGHDFADHA